MRSVRVLIAPDDFTGTLSAAAAAQAIAAGWHEEAPWDDLDLVPMSDGGPGFVEAVAVGLGDEAHGAEVHSVEVTGPHGWPVTAQFAICDGTAYVESAAACGLHLCPDPSTLLASGGPHPALARTSAGVGELIAAACSRDVHTVVVGVGGTGSCDGGAGLLGALGARATDAEGLPVELTAGPAGLREAAQVDLAPARARLEGIHLVLASDVDSPLLGPRGAARGFGPQKGVPDSDLDGLEEVLGTWAAAVGTLTVPGRPLGVDPAAMLGAGAGGGIGLALLAVGAARRPGIDVVMDALRLRDRVAACDLVVTGEGRLDWQSMRGKVVAGVAGLALEHVRPVVTLVGACEVGRREWVGLGISSVYTTAHEAGSAQAALREPAHWLRAAAARAARSWSRRPAGGLAGDDAGGSSPAV